jgi:hypothetical protein
MFGQAVNTPAQGLTDMLAPHSLERMTIDLQLADVPSARSTAFTGFTCHATRLGSLQVKLAADTAGWL